jgi:hypothetical protein
MFPGEFHVIQSSSRVNECVPSATRRLTAHPCAHRAELLAGHAYIQITNVLPMLDERERKARRSLFERSVRLSAF